MTNPPCARGSRKLTRPPLDLDAVVDTGTKAKNTLKALSVDAKVFELDNMDEGADWQAYLADKTGQRTVPMIFIGDKFIGGKPSYFGSVGCSSLALSWTLQAGHRDELTRPRPFLPVGRMYE